MGAAPKTPARRSIDLTAMQAAATEAAAERVEEDPGIELVLTNCAIVIPSTPPFTAGVLLQNGDFVPGFKALLGDEQWSTFVRTNPTEADFGVLLIGIAEAYGMEVPKSLRSGLGLPSDGTPSKRTGRGSTESTSLVLSGANRASRRAASRPSAKGSPTRRKAS
jgi:hypothetical protein